MKAGIDPDKPLPAWNFAEPPAPPARACAQGVGGQLRIPEGPPIDLGASSFGDFVVPSGRHQGETALDVMRLTAGAAAAVVSCTGEELAIEAGPHGRWLLVRTPQGWLKLVDFATDPMKPVQKDVTLVRRR